MEEGVLVLRIRIPREEAAAWARIYKEIGCSHAEIVEQLIRLCDHFALNQLSHFIEEGMRLARVSFLQRFNREMTLEEAEEVRLLILDQLRGKMSRHTPEDVAAKRVL